MSLPSRAGRALAISLSGLVTLAQPALAQPAPVAEPRLITMQGEGQAAANPDLAVVTGGTQIQARTARDAMEGNSRIMRAVQQALREVGVEERDISTSALSLQPTIEYQQNTNRPRVVGYSAGHQLTIRVRDLAKLGDVLDRMVTAGANQVDGLQLTVSDWSKKVDEARAAAIADAKRKASILAAAAGARIGRVMRIEEQGAAPPRPMPRMATAQAARADAVPVATGDQNFRMSVTVTWELVD
ncbi:SIMPL domain-containing protein [Phreatobacter stygius]|nr:SIMPL domain-containing protein [Phreatobacter stygius]